MNLKRRTKIGLPPVNPLAPSGAPAPKANASQAELRDRRRKRLAIHYTRTFSVSAEFEAVCMPTAHQISQLKDPLSMRRDIEAVLDAVHALMDSMVRLLTESKTADAGVTRRLVADLAVRPRLPEITDAQIISGSWVSKLTAWVEPYSGDLAALLGRALPPGHDGLRGNPSASERIERALRGLDAAVLTAERRLPKVLARQALPSIEDHNRQQRERQDAERANRVLAKLGART
ncbi:MULTISPECIES: hypothetical protein [Mycobacteroides]|uniref:Uncharacterized protein n=1 Tax=Mycobacteroides chelonae TaxID=1774 RepID=A0A1S1LU14_MYCCH|nr:MULTISPECIES: hypothetical protein [Mycobacteroides]KRQ26865.1 hypothetical protein AOT87_02420 [Mycobacteroides sp. H003]KRQ28721.1 hypothetical protein AOT91_18070 [Mycobacteroides sp. H092]KRQ44132.1 hypothetical protein AOT92_07370 [Mycobacteroides sp. H101]KRQ51002.1 hypothetical protein AOT88_06315 [Mycobacteroides sp. H063]KRQ57467.1 hypothetical protein AOT94_15965 [Mycobacteroides sp. HXVII]